MLPLNLKLGFHLGGFTFGVMLACSISNMPSFTPDKGHNDLRAI